MDYEPGLGCPHCKWAGYTAKERTDHISKKHPGEYAGGTEDMREIAEMVRKPEMASSGSEFELFRDRRKSR